MVTNNGQSISVWDLATASVVNRTRGHQETIRGMALSGDRTRLATSGDEGATKLWHLEDPRVLARWQPPQGEEISGLASDFVMTMDAAYVPRIYVQENGTPRVIGRKLVLAVGPHAERFGEDFLIWADAVVDEPWSLCLFDGKSGVEKFCRIEEWGQLRKGIHFYQVTLARQASLVAVGQHGGAIDVLDLRKGELRCTIPGDGAWGRVGAFGESGGWLAAIDDQWDIHLWNAQDCTRHAIITFTADEPFDRESLGEFVFSGQGDLLLRYQEHVVVYDVPTATERLRVDDPCPRSDGNGHAEISANGDLLVTYCGGLGRASIWDIDQGTMVAAIDEIDVSKRPIRPFSSSGDLFLGRTSGTSDLRIFDVATGKSVTRIRAMNPKNWPILLNFDEDKATVRVVEADGALYTYATTRAGTVAAACHALAGSEVYDQVEVPCAQWR